MLGPAGSLSIVAATTAACSPRARAATLANPLRAAHGSIIKLVLLLIRKLNTFVSFVFPPSDSAHLKIKKRKIQKEKSSSSSHTILLALLPPHRLSAQSNLVKATSQLVPRRVSRGNSVRTKLYQIENIKDKKNIQLTASDVTRELIEVR